MLRQESCVNVYHSDREWEARGITSDYYRACLYISSRVPVTPREQRRAATREPVRATVRACEGRPGVLIHMWCEQALQGL